MAKKNQNMGYHSKADFNLNDKSDFPDLVPQKPVKIGSSDSHNSAGSGGKEKFTDMISSTKNKPATY